MHYFVINKDKDKWVFEATQLFFHNFFVIWCKKRLSNLSLWGWKSCSSKVFSSHWVLILSRKWLMLSLSVEQKKEKEWLFVERMFERIRQENSFCCFTTFVTDCCCVHFMSMFCGQCHGKNKSWTRTEQEQNKRRVRRVFCWDQMYSLFFLHSMTIIELWSHVWVSREHEDNKDLLLISGYILLRVWGCWMNKNRSFVPQKD